MPPAMCRCKALVGSRPASPRKSAHGRSKGSGVLHPEAKLEPWLSAGARVRYLIPLGYRLGMLLQADATWLGSRPEFFLDDLGTVFVPPTFGARLGSGLQLRF